jgi:trimeric autotransporter adhesin
VKGRKIFTIALIMTMISAAKAQEPSAAKKAGTQPQAAAASVTGSGTTGQLSKWLGVDGASTHTLGDSIIFEDKFGKVGIGTRTPLSKLTIVGMVETTLGGYKFPDGTVQTTAGVAPNQVVKSLNGLMGNLTLQAGANITITPSSNTLTITASGLLSGVSHDATLTGNGTSASPLGLQLPLSLVAPPGAAGLNVTGGSGAALLAPTSVVAQGNFNSSSNTGGAGVNATGGNPGGPGVNATGGAGGVGVNATGGGSGVGVNATGGSGCTAIGPFAPTCEGVRATGGSHGSAGLTAMGFSSSGNGVVAQGGTRSVGVFATGGNDPDTFAGGDGVNGFGGKSNGGVGGAGVTGTGGNSGAFGTIGRGGAGGSFNGGSGGSVGGIGVVVHGGAGVGQLNSPGGPGLVVTAGGNGPMTPLPLRALAGHFMGGDVNIDGGVIRALQKLFHIDHPLDPENKFLNHVSIESSEVLNFYSGNVTTDGNGDAIVTLPDWFEALNKDCRYQLTVIGTFAQAIVAEKIKGNRFTIKTNASNVEVSWQVTGVRSDPATRKHPLVVEEAKSETERGHYLSPEAYDQPEEKGLNWAHYPQLMQQIKEAREKIKREKN